MITIPNSIQKDLITDINNFDVMAVISSANDTFYISTKQQYFEHNYYEDLDLRVSGLKESINFKSKKVKMSGTTITLNNYEINGKRFTDRAKYGLANATVEIYLKTGSCESLEDCAKLATLKVTRFDQDKEKVTIKCEEYLTQSLNTELPKKEYTLYSEDNEGATLGGKTYEVYNEERIPILYGHLKEAPAITFIDNETNIIKVLPDRAAIDDSYDIFGIKPMRELDNFQIDNDPGGFPGPGYQFQEFNANVTDLIDQDILTVKLGDGGCRVYKVFPKQINFDVFNVQKFDKQFDIYNNFISFYEEQDQLGTKSSIYLSKGVLLVGEISKLKLAKTHLNTYAVRDHPYNSSNSNYFGRYDFGETYSGDDFDLFTQSSARWENPVLSGVEPPYSEVVIGGQFKDDVNIDGFDYGIVNNPCIEFEFEEMKSTPDVYVSNIGSQSPTDFNLISFITLKTISTENEIGTSTQYPTMQLCFVPEKADHNFGDTLEIGSENADSLYTNQFGFSSQTLNGIERFGNTVDGLMQESGYNSSRDSILATSPYVLSFTNEFKNFDSSGPVYDTIDTPLIQYSHPFNVPLELDAEQINQWRNIQGFQDSYSMHDSRSILLHFVPNDSGEYAEINETSMRLFAEFNGMLMRRTWYQNNALNNKFFINAKGRCSGYPTDNTRIWDIKGMKLKCWSEQFIASGGVLESYFRYDDASSDDFLLRHLLDYLGNEKLKYNTEINLSPEIMIKVTHNENFFGASPSIYGMEDEVNYIYDLEINNLTSTTWSDSSDIIDKKLYNFYINGTLFRKENPNNEFTDQILDASFASSDIQFVYCFKELDSEGNVIDITEVDSEELSEFNEAIADLGGIDDSYSRLHLMFSGNKLSPAKKIIKTPKVIVKDLMNREFGQGFETKNTDDRDYELNFSIDKPQKTVDVLQQVAQNTNFFYKTGLSNSKPTVIGMKNSYSGEDVDKTIFVDYIESYKFSKTNIEDLAVKCRVKYGYDYITESFKHVTEEVQVTNTEDYKAYYGLTDNDIDGDEFLLEHEAPYIQDEPTAILLRNHLHELHKNQHTIVDFKINLSQGFELEVGDTINFKAIGDGDYKSFFSPYGVDIMSITGLPFLPGIENQQAVLPYFMITDINKTMDSVSIKAIQIHELIGLTQIPEPPIDDDDDTGDDDTGDDDTGDDDTEDDLIQTAGDLNLDGTPYETVDYLMLLGYITYGQQESGVYNFSEQQILNADINNDGNIDALDLVAFMDGYIETMGDSYLPGDVTEDGYVTQADVDAAQAYVDDPVANPLSLNAIANGDIAEPRDGMITEEDVAAIDAIKKVPPAEIEPIGDLLIDTAFNESLGVLAMYHSGDNIIIEIAEAHSINEGMELNVYLEQLSSNNLTLVGTNITFQPTLTGDLGSPQYYPWLNAAGYYTIESIVHISDVAPQLKRFIITLDAPEVDGSNLIGIGAYNDYSGGINDTNVKIYGTPELISDDTGDDGYSELLSTRHHYAASGLDADIGIFAYATGIQISAVEDKILTGADNTIAPNATLSELRDARPDIFTLSENIYCKINVSYNQEYEDYAGVPNALAMEKINNWLAFDGFFGIFSAGNDFFFKLGYDYMLYPDGQEVGYVNIGGYRYIDLYQDGNAIALDFNNFALKSSLEDYIILTISYPVESNE